MKYILTMLINVCDIESMLKDLYNEKTKIVSCYHKYYSTVNTMKSYCDHL